MIKLRLEIAAEPVRGLEPARSGYPFAQVVFERHRVAAGEAIERQDQEAAAMFVEVALVGGLEELHRLREDHRPIDAVASPRESESVFAPVAVVHLERGAFEVRLAANADDPDGRDHVAVEASDEQRIGGAEPIAIVGCDAWAARWAGARRRGRRRSDLSSRRSSPRSARCH